MRGTPAPHGGRGGRAVLSALLSVILAMYDTGRWNVIIASVITSTIGALLVTHRDRNIDALRRKA